MNGLICGLIVALASGETAPATQPAVPPLPELKYVYQADPKRTESKLDVYVEIDPNEPLQFQVDPPVRRMGLPGESSGEGADVRSIHILATAGSHEFSEEQRRLLADVALGGVLRVGLDDGRPWAPGTNRRFLHIPAATEADVKPMVQALWEGIAAAREQVREKVQRKIYEVSELLPPLEQRAAKLQAEAEQADAARKAAWEQMGYRDTEELQRDQFELERAARAVQIESAGIRAKMEAIEKVRARGRATDEGTRLLLDRLQIEQDVELAGALARQNAIAVRQAAAREYQTLEKTSGGRALARHVQQGSLEEQQKKLADLKQTLSEVVQETPLRLRGDEVIIRGPERP
jgi:hypothetical protein